MKTCNKLKQCGTRMLAPLNITPYYVNSLHPIMVHTLSYKLQFLQELVYFMYYVFFLLFVRQADLWNASPLYLCKIRFDLEGLFSECISYGCTVFLR